MEKQTEMYLFYMDESYDTNSYAYSSVFVPAFCWNGVFRDVVSWRRDLFKNHSIDPEYEIHATDFIGGRGQPHNNRDKKYRAKMFNEFIKVFENLHEVFVINAITGTKQNYPRLFERMLNRINRTLEMKNAYGVLVCDEGNEGKLISMVRKMKKENYILSRNIPLDRIIEDPLFKTSESSYFIQIADSIAFALLRNEYPKENTLEEVKTAFENLDKVLVKKAYSKDPKGKGIVRT